MINGFSVDWTANVPFIINLRKEWGKQQGNFMMALKKIKQVLL